MSAARLGWLNAGLISSGRLITHAVSIPVIGDADTGYGNAKNVKRTVKGYIKAGFAGIVLEDQVFVIHIYFCRLYLLSILCFFYVVLI